MENKLEEQLDINNNLGNLIEKNKKSNEEDISKEVNNNSLIEFDNNSSLENHIFNNINIYNNNFNNKNITPEEYDIISNKTINNLNWYLLKLKNKNENNDYNDFIWLPENKINILQYNIIHNNNDEQINTVLSKKLKDLEQKEDIISKLKFENEKLKQKNSNFKKRFSEIKDNESINSHISDLQKYQNNDVPFEKYTQIINNYNNLDIKYSKLKKKN